jgi:hypothetical protein
MDASVILSFVIPGRRISVEPGIHFTASHEAKWIPGPRLTAHPGMTKGRVLQAKAA